MLKVDTLVIDEKDRIGDNWRRRYHQLVLHDPVWFDHMPYLPFPQSWPVFTPKDKLAEFFEAYAKLLELNVWTRTTLKSSSWSDVLPSEEQEVGSREPYVQCLHILVSAAATEAIYMYMLMLYELERTIKPEKIVRCLHRPAGTA
jgi:hypothetical protein